MDQLKLEWIRRHLDPDSVAQYEHVLEKRSEQPDKLKKEMTGHLSTLNDGVMAIFITVMMLEIPYPTTERSYFEFFWSVLVFLVSFFIIADFWYENKAVFQIVREADHIVVVANFLFLASLALIPVTTKWIINETNRAGALHFGAVYCLTTLLHQFLYYTAVRTRLKRHLRLLLHMMAGRIGFLLAVNASLMLVAWFQPKWAILLYIILPVIRFFMP